MSISDTSKAQKYASVAEVAAAQAKIYAEKLEDAPDYASQAEQAAISALSSSQSAAETESRVNDLAVSASQSASSAAESAAAAGDAAGAAIGRSVRAPSGESLSELPNASERASSLISFDNIGAVYVKPLSDFAPLDSEGKIPVSIIPSVALSKPFVVSGQSEMLSLDAQVGDIAKRTDLGYSFCLAASPATEITNWVQLTDDVLSQLGDKTGASSVGATDPEGGASTVQAQLNEKMSKQDLASASGSTLVGMSPQGTLANIVSWVTPEQFGAVGDGATDDTAAIQAAIDYLYNAGGGDVVIGPKTYRADNLIIKDFVRIKGQSIMNSRIKANDSWTGLAVISTVDFDAFRAAGIYGGGTYKGTWGAVIEDVAIDGNYQNFGGTASISSGHGICLAGWSNYVKNIDIKWCAGTGLVKLSKTGIPDDYPDDKTDATLYTSSHISIMYCGNDAMYTADHDQVYHNILIGVYACTAAGDIILEGPSFWDSVSRRCTGWYACNVVDVDQVHIYGCYVGYGLIVGDSDATVFPTRFQYGRIIIESVMIAAWFRPTSYVMGTTMDCHDISQNIALSAHSTYGTYPPQVIIESGGAVTDSTRRLLSDFGFIKTINLGTSTVDASVGFNGPHIALAGENNTVRLKCHRSKYSTDTRGGTGVICAGINNTIASGSEIVGFLSNNSDGNPSYAIDTRAGSITSIDVSVRMCNVCLKWSSSSSQPTMLGRIFYRDNITTVESLYSANATLVQRGLLEIFSPTGSSRQSCWGAAGSVSVTSTALQTVTITGLNLPYVPIVGEVSCFLTNTNTSAQSAYAGLQSCHYIPGSSTTTTLSFRVMVDVVSGANTAAALRVKLN